MPMFGSLVAGFVGPSKQLLYSFGRGALSLGTAYSPGAFPGHRRLSSACDGMKYLKQDEAVAIDQELFTEYGFSVDQLMELAGLSCAHAVASSFPRGKVLVVAGPGNNGGDGFVCARHLKLFGYTPSILYPKQSSSELMKRLVTQVTKMGISFVNEDSIKQPSNICNDYAMVVDAIFGFSFRPPLRPPFDTIIDAITKSAVPVFSIDIPSGWHVEDGPPADGAAISPSVLISLTAPKLCARHASGIPHYLGGRFVPQALADKYELALPPYPSTDCIVKLPS
uniref:NAD(P)H-hydrate epimerase n=1 Tax=Parascaris univalens TaxID=6257 RepID=A0A915BSK5_PARUN